MQYALIVRLRKSGAQLAGDIERLLPMQATDALQERSQVLAVDVLHSEEVPSLEFANISLAADVGMRHLAPDANLGKEALAAHRVVGQRRRQGLERDGLAEVLFDETIKGGRPGVSGSAACLRKALRMESNRPRAPAATELSPGREQCACRDLLPGKKSCGAHSAYACLTRESSSNQDESCSREMSCIADRTQFRGFWNRSRCTGRHDFGLTALLYVLQADTVPALLGVGTRSCCTRPMAGVA